MSPVDDATTLTASMNAVKRLSSKQMLMLVHLFKERSILKTVVSDGVEL